MLKHNDIALSELCESVVDGDERQSVGWSKSAEVYVVAPQEATPLGFKTDGTAIKWARKGCFPHMSREVTYEQAKATGLHKVFLIAVGAGGGGGGGGWYAGGGGGGGANLALLLNLDNVESLDYSAASGGGGGSMNNDGGDAGNSTLLINGETVATLYGGNGGKSNVAGGVGAPAPAVEARPQLYETLAAFGGKDGGARSGAGYECFATLTLGYWSKTIGFAPYGGGASTKGGTGGCSLLGKGGNNGGGASEGWGAGGGAKDYLDTGGAANGGKATMKLYY